SEAGKEKVVFAAWVDPIQLAAGKAAATSDYLKITASKAEPSLTPPDGKVKITATIAMPPDPKPGLVVIARHAETGKSWELAPGENGTYSAEIPVDKSFPRKDQVISVLAYAADESKPGRRPEVEKALESGGYWDLKKPFVRNPLICASR